MPIWKKLLSGILSTLGWVTLVLALLASSANLIVNNLNHVGDSASTVLKGATANTEALNSLLDEFADSADPQLANEIQKNRKQIIDTLTSLGSSKEFESEIASTLNKIAQAGLGGASSVTVDFTKIATLVAEKVNASSKSTVIKKSDLAKIKPSIIDLSEQAKTIQDVKKYLHLSLLLWLLWFLLLGLLFIIKGARVLRTSGFQLLSIGIMTLVLKFSMPSVIATMLRNSDSAVYVKDLLPRVFNTLSTPLLLTGIVFSVLGTAFVLLATYLSDMKKVDTALVQ